MGKRDHPVGELHWEGCETCKHANHEEGGCLVMSAMELGNKYNFELDYENIICKKWEATNGTG